MRVAVQRRRLVLLQELGVMPPCFVYCVDVLLPCITHISCECRHPALQRGATLCTAECASQYCRVPRLRPSTQFIFLVVVVPGIASSPLSLAIPVMVANAPAATFATRTRRCASNSWSREKPLVELSLRRISNASCKLGSVRPMERVYDSHGSEDAEDARSISHAS